MRRRASAQPLSAAHPTLQRVVQELGRPESLIARRMKDIAHQLVSVKSRSILALRDTRFIALQTTVHTSSVKQVMLHFSWVMVREVLVSAKSFPNGR